MDHVIGHVVRRGMEAHAQWSNAAIVATGNPVEQRRYELPAWGAMLLGGTIVTFVVTLTLVEYTYGRLIPALLMVESPTAILFEPLATQKPDAPVDDSEKRVEPELLLIKQQPITSKFRTTLKHLREKAGRWSRFRAYSIFIVYSLLVSHLTFFLRSMRVPMGLDAVIAATVFTRLQMGWTHIAISDPSPKYWFRRLPSIKLWKKVAIPTAILAASQQVTILLPTALACTLGLSKTVEPAQIARMTTTELNMYFVKVVSVVLVVIFCAVSIVIPASVSLTRVQASLLSEEEETIVPCDRSFGGRVIPAVVGGSGAIGILDAWKSFDWNSRVRLLKTYGKVFVMEVSLCVLFSIVLGTELHLIMGDDMKKIMRAAYAEGKF